VTIPVFLHSFTEYRDLIRKTRRWTAAFKRPMAC